MALINSNFIKTTFWIIHFSIVVLTLYSCEQYIGYDYDAEQGMETRRRLLEMGSSEKALMHVFHFPFPGLGHVSHSGTGWEWHPL